MISRLTLFRCLWTCLVPALLMLGCGNDDDTSQSLAALIAATTHGTGVDYTPLDNPTNAINSADAIIGGILIDIRPGIRVSESGTTDPRFNDNREVASYYVAYVIDVSERLSNKSTVTVPDEIEVQVLSDTQVSAAELARLNTRPEVIVALDMVSATDLDGISLKTESGSLVKSVFFPFTDMFWLDDGTGPKALYLDSLDELAPGWGSLSSLADLKNSLR